MKKWLKREKKCLQNCTLVFIIIDMYVCITLGQGCLAAFLFNITERSKKKLATLKDRCRKECKSKQALSKMVPCQVH